MHQPMPARLCGKGWESPKARFPPFPACVNLIASIVAAERTTGSAFYCNFRKTTQQCASGNIFQVITMPYASTRDHTRLYYEETGKGTPLIFVHEFSGDYRSWEAQVRFFSRRYRCITFSARGYPPSDVPKARTKYSWRIAVDDIADVLRHLLLRKAHVVGCSMGAYSSLQFGMRYPAMALSVTSVGAGAGSNPDTRAAFLRATEANARLFETLGMPAAVRERGFAAARIPQMLKDPRGFAEFRRIHESHSAIGLAHVQRGVQARRPPIYQLESAFRCYRPPLMVIAGDEDDNSIGPALFVKQVSAHARLWICPSTGHTVNTEEPDLFNRNLLDFLTLVDTGRWKARDPRSVAKKK
jgi:pimeloyl-ACP methyl ester carboxylesterase